jgi:hypothetical protein
MTNICKEAVKSLLRKIGNHLGVSQLDRKTEELRSQLNLKSEELRKQNALIEDKLNSLQLALNNFQANLSALSQGQQETQINEKRILDGQSRLQEDLINKSSAFNQFRASNYFSESAFLDEYINRVYRVGVSNPIRPENIDADYFLLQHFYRHIPQFDGCINYGDYIQTIAVKSILSSITPNPRFSYWDRDNLAFFKSDKSSALPVCVMQGWFSHSYNSFPAGNFVPLWMGTHFYQGIQPFIVRLLAMCPDYFKSEVGCRDLFTLKFCRKNKIPSYFSRCLTLTLPRRAESRDQNRVFFVNIPREWHALFPKEIITGATFLNQKWVHVGEHYEYSNEKASKLIRLLADRAKLVVTTALHCAAPCIAMGIPVVLLSDNPDENKTRFSALGGILEARTLEDLKRGTVAFDLEPLEIQDLKDAMKTNLQLSLGQLVGKEVNFSEQREIREFIERYKVRGV